MVSRIREKVDVCVVGAGHAGCEAALACARLGLNTVIKKYRQDIYPVKDVKCF